MIPDVYYIRSAVPGNICWAYRIGQIVIVLGGWKNKRKTAASVTRNGLYGLVTWILAMPEIMPELASGKPG
jgi:hypothetical protein